MLAIRKIATLSIIVICLIVTSVHAQVNDTLPSSTFSWQANDTTSSFIQRLRQNSAYIGADCKLETADLQELGGLFDVGISGVQTTVGKTIKVNWRKRVRRQSMPVYFMVSANQPIRFKGKGFYALTANAIGPFGIQTYVNEDRAIVALYGNDIELQGTIEVEPLVAGTLKLHTSVIGYMRRCQQEAVASAGETEIRINPSTAAQVGAKVQFAQNTDDKYQLSPRGDRVLVQNKTSVKLLSRDRQSVIVQFDGKNALFSPSGRFFSVERGSGKDFFDAIDGKLLAHNKLSYIGWLNNDSFQFFTGYRYGALVLNNLLVDKATGPIGQSLCGGCNAIGGKGFRLDLENNVVAEHTLEDDQREATFQILGHKNGYDQYNSSGDRHKYQSLVPFAPFSIPAGFEHRHPLFKELWSSDNAPSTSKQLGTTSDPIELRPKYVKLDAISTGTQQTYSAGNWQGTSRDLTVSERRPQDLWHILDSLSLLTHEEIPATYDSKRDKNPVDYNPEKGFGNYIRDRIEKDIPGSARLITNSFDSGLNGGCFKFGDEISVNFDQASRFQFDNQIVWVPYFSCQEGTGSFDSSITAAFMSNASKPFQIHDTAKEGGAGNFCASIFFCEHSVVMPKAGYLAYFSQAAKGIALVRLQDGKTIFKKYDIPEGGGVAQVRLTQDDRHVVQYNEDGALFVHRIADGKTVLKGRYIDNEIALWSDSLLYDATPEGAHFVNLSFPGYEGQYTLQQYGPGFKTSGLAALVLAGKTEAAAGPVPIPPSLKGQFVSADDGTVTGTITATTTTRLKAVKVFEDGIFTQEFSNFPVDQVVPIKFKRSAGTRWINLIAVDENGLQSQPLGRDMGTFVGSLPKVRMLTVGIDQYDSENVPDLGFAASDAKRIAKSLSNQNGKSINLVHAVNLTDQQATKNAILNNVETLVSQMSATDTAVLFFAGHGVRGKDGRFYIVLSDTDAENISSTSLLWDDVSQILKKAKGRVVVLLDACHSGSAGTGFLATNDDVVNGILNDVPSGITILAAAKGRQQSIEDERFGGGLFTAAVASVLSEKRSKFDIDGNGSIEVSELYKGVKALVTAVPEGGHTPWLSRNQMIGDYALF